MEALEVLEALEASPLRRACPSLWASCPWGRGGARAGAGAGPGGQAAGGRGAARRPAPDLRHGQVHGDEDKAGAGQYIV